jgi:NlpC/P60 family putative phage cell wall peptidase
MKEVTRKAIVNEARRWIGTPYRHQASLVNVGTDCLGLVRGVWRAIVGSEPERPPAYTPDWAEKLGRDDLLEAARRWLVEIPVGDAREGDVLLFRMATGAPAKHAAIVSGSSRIIHAYWGRSVCETHLTPWWGRRIAAAFSFPGLRADG